VKFVEILGHPFESRRQTHRLPTAGLIGRAPKQLALETVSMVPPGINHPAGARPISLSAHPAA